MNYLHGQFVYMWFLGQHENDLSLVFAFNWTLYFTITLHNHVNWGI